MDEKKKRALDFIDGNKEFFFDLSDRIWENPETAFEEYASSKRLRDALADLGFEVEEGIAGLETAFKGTFGEGPPHVGILGEFDALSGMSQAAGLAEKRAEREGENGHGCGHNMLGVGSLAAAAGIREYLSATGGSGTVTYFGTPAEEGGSGKTFMAREGVFDGLDFALCWHPEHMNCVLDMESLANYQISYKFRGTSAHAAAFPHQGRSALDAMELMNVGVQFLREHMIPEARVHYAITNSGGNSPNVVQSFAEALYLIRAPRTSQVEELYTRINKIAQGAALMTETEVEIGFVKACSNYLPNGVVGNLLSKNLREVPLPVYSRSDLDFFRSFADTLDHSTEKLRERILAHPTQEPEELLRKLDDPIYNFLLPESGEKIVLPASTDVGDVSWICPTGQIMVATWAAGTPAHSWQAVAQGKGPGAHGGLLFAGKVLAGTAIDLIERPELVSSAREELTRRLDGKKYVCPIPPDVRPRKIAKP